MHGRFFEVDAGVTSQPTGSAIGTIDADEPLAAWPKDQGPETKLRSWRNAFSKYSLTLVATIVVIFIAIKDISPERRVVVGDLEAGKVIDIAGNVIRPTPLQASLIPSMELVREDKISREQTIFVTEDLDQFGQITVSYHLLASQICALPEKESVGTFEPFCIRNMQLTDIYRSPDSKMDLRPRKEFLNPYFSTPTGLGYRIIKNGHSGIADNQQE
jgi:hypothetical protein